MADMFGNNYGYNGYNYGPPRFNPNQFTPQNMNMNQPQMNNNQMMNMQNQQFNSQGYVCRPVTSREEALAVQVDFFGPGTVMVDLSHNVIFLKKFNTNTGASEFFEFVYKPKQENTSDSQSNSAESTQETKPSYDPRPDIKELYNRISGIEDELDSFKNYSKPAPVNKKNVKAANEE